MKKSLTQNIQFKIKNLPCPQEKSGAACKSYVKSELNGPSLIRNTAHVDFVDKKLGNVRFIKVSSFPAVRDHLTPKFYVMKLFLKV